MSDNSSTAPSFLGTGWSFPPTFVRGPVSGEVLMTTGEADIDASLRILLGTALGERFLNPKYGLDMRGLLFEPMATTLLTLAKDQIKVALLIYEARIKVVSLEFDTSTLNEGKVSVVLDYEIRATNSRYNLVYPFYLSDGSEVAPSL